MSRVRHSVEWLQQQYSEGNRKPLETVIRAWKGIQDRSQENPNDPDGFFVIGGYHGEPFHGAGQQSSDAGYWGGYCNHGNVLFPTWHRAYLLRLENAMRTVPGCEDVTLPFWDEMSYYTGEPGKAGPPKAIPTVLTDETFPLDGKDIPNPLRCFVFPRKLADAGDAKNVYDKYKGYETVRFPLSGLVGTPEAKKASEALNADYTKAEAADVLNQNVSTWLNEGAKIPKPTGDPNVRVPDSYSVGARYVASLNCPNYMVFSNKTSAQQYMTDHDIEADTHLVVSLEDPHNAIHLAVGGIYQPSNYLANPRPYRDANGDMGENNTAGLDPIFFFHHCFIDYTFWCWQRKKNLQKRGSLNVEWGYAGTNSSDGGTPAYQAANIFIDMDTPLYPFKKPDGKWYTSNDVTDIEEVGYSYGIGSLEPYVKEPTLDQHRAFQDIERPVHVLRVAGVNRAKHEGSFVIRTFIKKGEESHEVGREAILSRYKVNGCRNCQNHLEVKSYVPVTQGLMSALGIEDMKSDKVEVSYSIQTHGGSSSAGQAQGVLSDAAPEDEGTVEIL